MSVSQIFSHSAVASVVTSSTFDDSSVGVCAIFILFFPLLLFVFALLGAFAVGAWNEMRWKVNSNNIEWVDSVNAI